MLPIMAGSRSLYHKGIHGNQSLQCGLKLRYVFRLILVRGWRGGRASNLASAVLIREEGATLGRCSCCPKEPRGCTTGRCLQAVQCYQSFASLLLCLSRLLRFINLLCVLILEGILLWDASVPSGALYRNVSILGIFP